MKFAAALVAVLFLLAGLWFLYEPSGAASSDASRSSQFDRTDANGTEEGTDELAAVSPDSRNRAESVERQAESNSLGDPGRAHASMASPGARVRTVIGKIADADGAPLPASDVRARKEGSLWDLATAQDEAHTNAQSDGTFSIVVPEGSLEVIAGADGYAPLVRRIASSESGEIDLGTLRLAPGVTLLGRVTDAAGRPVSGAALHRKGASRGGFVLVNGRGAVVTRTDDAGRFEVRRQAPGAFEFAVVHSEHPDGTFDGSTEDPGETVTGIEVQLGMGATVSGIARGVPKDVAGEVEIRALYSPPGSGEGALDFGRLGRGGQIAPDGSFSVHGLPLDAEIELRLIRGQGSAFERTRCSESVLCRAGDRAVAIAYSEGASIEFRVSDRAGNPVEGATISTGFDFAIPYSGEDVDLGAGRYRLGELWPPDAAGSELDISVLAPGFETASLDSVRLRPGETLDLGTVELEPKPTVTVTVVEEVSRRPIEGARVRLRPEDRAFSGTTRAVFLSSPIDDPSEMPDLKELDGGPAEGLTDAEGRCTLEVQPGGDGVFEVTHKRFAEVATESMSIDSLGVAGSPGEFAVEIALVPGGSIEVTVVDPDGVPVAGRDVQRKAFAGGPKPSPVTTDAEGTARFEGVAAGEHRVRLAAKKRGGGGFMLIVPGGGGSGSDEEYDDWTNVTVVAGETSQAQLIAPFPSTLRGVVTEGGVPLAGAEVRVAPEDDGGARQLGTLFGGSDAVTTDARGEFFFDDVDVGAHVLTIDHNSRSMPFKQAVEIEEGRNETEADLDVTIVQGICRDAAGKPLAGARVSASRVQGTGRRMASIRFQVAGGGESTTLSSGTPTTSVVTGGDGRFELRGVEAEVPIVVKASADGYDTAESEPIEVPRGGVEDGVELRFEKPGDLVIEVEGNSGNALIAVATRVDATGGTPHTERFSGSETTIEDLEPGEWSVTVTAVTIPGADPVTVTPENQSVTIEPGETAKLRYEVE